MLRAIPYLPVLLAALGAACSRGGDADARRDTSVTTDVTTPAPDTTLRPDVVRAVDSVAPGRVALRRERWTDLTRDGRPERLGVQARGPRFQALDVRLEIAAPDGRMLYLARWSSERYFHYDGLEGKADSTVARMVREHVDRLLGDSAFVRRQLFDGRGRPVPVDTEAVRYDVAEMDLRRRRGVADTMPTPTTLVIHVADDSGGTRTRGEVSARAAALAVELRDRPRFTYFAGGEETYSIAWSDRERRFVRVFACC